MRLNLVERTVSVLFHRLGRVVARHPLPFILVPLALSLALSTGFLRLHMNNDPEYLFTPEDGKGRRARAMVEQLFPADPHDFDPGRTTRLGHYAHVIATFPDAGKNVLTVSNFERVVELDRAIRNLSIGGVGKEGGKTASNFTFRDICARFDGACVENDVLKLLGPRIGDIELGLFKVRYPLHMRHSRADFYGSSLGGVSIDEHGYISSARALALTYHLNMSKVLEPAVEEWCRRVEELTDFFTIHREDMEVTAYTSFTYSQEANSNTVSVFKDTFYTSVGMILFTVLACLLNDAVRSKPILGVLACLSANLATSAAIGTCLYRGLPFNHVTLGVPFLMMGIALDDTFDLLAAWWRTNADRKVEDRMAEAYAHAGISVTVTSLTNLISFLVCTLTPFPGLYFFSVYASTAVVFAFFYQITFFGACMTFFGRLEAENRHCITGKPALPKSKALDKGRLYRLFCTGGRNNENPNNPADHADHFLSIFMRDAVAKQLAKGWGR